MRKLAIGMRVKLGFTLIEILVVLLIVGITMSAALLAFGDFGASRKAQVSAEHFANYLNLLEHQSILEMKSYGIRIEGNTYQTFRYEGPKNWKLMPESSLFHRQVLPQTIKLEIKSSSLNNQPSIIIYPSGEYGPFKLFFGNHAKPKCVKLQSVAGGRLEISPVKNDS